MEKEPEVIAKWLNEASLPASRDFRTWLDETPGAAELAARLDPAFIESMAKSAKIRQIYMDMDGVQQIHREQAETCYNIMQAFQSLGKRLSSQALDKIFSIQTITTTAEIASGNEVSSYCNRAAIAAFDTIIQKLPKKAAKVLNRPEFVELVNHAQKRFGEMYHPRRPAAYIQPVSAIIFVICDK